MFTLKQTILLALAGSAIAAPFAHPHRRQGNGPYTGRMSGSQGFNPEAYSPVAGGVSAGETIVTVTYYPNQPQATGSFGGFGSGSSAPAATATAAASTGSSTGTSSGSDSTDGYMAIVNKWRKAGGLPEFTQSSKLEGNALKTAQDGNGQMKHELNPGTMGQVLAPGNANNFESVYVGGWLCEKPSLPGLNGICTTMTAGWDHSNGETGHADILTSTSYTQIGCQIADGIWACDVA